MRQMATSRVEKMDKAEPGDAHVQVQRLQEKSECTWYQIWNQLIIESAHRDTALPTCHGVKPEDKCALVSSL